MSLLISCLFPIHPSIRRQVLQPAVVCTCTAWNSSTDLAAQDATGHFAIQILLRAASLLCICTCTPQKDGPHTGDRCRVLGKNNENLGKIISVMAKCLSKGKAGKEGLVDEPTWQRMLVLLQQMNSSLPSQVLLWQ